MDADPSGIQFFSRICNNGEGLKLSLRRKSCEIKNQGWEPIHQKYKAKRELK
jgi:hypothetical protein